MHGRDDMGPTRGDRNYLAYLLRLWRTGPGKSAGWRASLQDPHTSQRIEFANLEDVVAFLKQCMGEGEPGAGDKTEGGAGFRKSCSNEFNKEKCDE